MRRTISIVFLSDQSVNSSSFLVMAGYSHCDRFRAIVHCACALESFAFSIVLLHFLIDQAHKVEFFPGIDMPLVPFKAGEIGVKHLLKGSVFAKLVQGENFSYHGVNVFVHSFQYVGFIDMGKVLVGGDGEDAKKMQLPNVACLHLL